ncbi:MAG: hypothetical protein GY765_17225, partial [bacterium]|nr:hypothetical protein [bacterium]
PKGNEFAALVDEGVHFNGSYFFKNEHHDQNVKIILRNPKSAFALFTHRKENIYDYGFQHQGCDVVVLENAHEDEEILKRDLLPGGYLVEIGEEELIVYKGEEVSGKFSLKAEDGKEIDKDEVLLSALEPLLKDLVTKYD